MDLIVPMAGLSTRYPGDVPKYLWHTRYTEPMFQRTIDAWANKVGSVYFAILKEHEEQFGVSERLHARWANIHYITIDSVLPGPAATIAHIIRTAKLSGGFVVRDIDAAFEPMIWDFALRPNSVYMCDTLWESVTDMDAKSYATIIGNTVTQIEERPKTKPSNWFCCGGWTFESAALFLDAFERCDDKEIFVSHVINELIKRDKQFKMIPCHNYEDWGTYEAWKLTRQRLEL